MAIDNTKTSGLVKLGWVKILKETSGDKGAYQLQLPEGDLWLPKSQVNLDQEQRQPGNNRIADVTITHWIATRKGLI